MYFSAIRMIFLVSEQFLVKTIPGVVAVSAAND